MSDPFVGQITMFAGTFAPRGWALCDGQLMAVSQNDALFSLLGTIYGGDGRTTFGLPDLRGRVPIHQGTGPGLSQRRIGAKSGTETVTVTANELPSHTHAVRCSTKGGNQRSPIGAIPAVDATGVTALYSTGGGDSNTEWPKGEAVGGSQSHTNIMPFLCINFIIALFGVYPSRT